MSPEQVRGERDIDLRTDIWALGVVLYELVTASVPWSGDSLWKIFNHVTDKDPPPPSSRRTDLPPGFEAVVLRCLEKERDKRPQTVVELALLLAPYVPESARPLVERVERVQSAREEPSRPSRDSRPSREPVVIPATVPAAPALGFQKTELSQAGARVTAAGVTQTNAGAPARRPNRLAVAGVVVGLLIAAVVGSMRFTGSSVPPPVAAASPPALPPPPPEHPTSLPAPKLPPLPPEVPPPPPVGQAPVVPAALDPVVEPVLPPILKPPPAGAKPPSGPVAKPKPTSTNTPTKSAPDRHNVQIP
jgi:serine/threonine-protein kinase